MLCTTYSQVEPSNFGLQQAFSVQRAPQGGVLLASNPINVTAFNWGPTAGTPPSTDVTKYMAVIAMMSPPYLLNIVATSYDNVFGLCEEY
jgi:hypothetical protein